MATELAKYLVCVWKTDNLADNSDWYAEVTAQSGAKATGKGFWSRNAAIKRAIMKLDKLHEETADSASEEKWPKDWKHIMKIPSAVGNE